MSEHTQGNAPWLAVKAESHGTSICTEAGYPVAWVPADYVTAEEAHRRAVLMAASEDLLAALRECVEDSQEAVNAYVETYGDEWKPHRLAALRETVAKARAAIARATGGKTT